MNNHEKITEYDASVGELNPLVGLNNNSEEENEDYSNFDGWNGR